MSIYSDHGFVQAETAWRRERIGTSGTRSGSSTTRGHRLIKAVLPARIVRTSAPMTTRQA